jgi:hypothetical protein
MLAGLQEFVGLALTLGERRPRAVDVRPGPRMRAIEEQHARPDVNGFFVFAREVLIEPLYKQRVGLAVPIHRLRIQEQRIGASKLRHFLRAEIITTRRDEYKAIRTKEPRVPC